MKGKVKWFNTTKGFGFIISEELPDKDIFIHYSAIVGKGFKNLIDGQSVTFDLVQTDKGPAAKNIFAEAINEK